MFKTREIKKKTWTLIIAGALAGAILGFVLINDLLMGLLVGFLAGAIGGAVKYGMAIPKEREQKRRMRMVVWMLSASVILGAVLYGYRTGNIISGIGAGIGLIFSVGASMDSMYDERMGNIFSKAARNAFIVLTMTMSVIGFMDEAIEIVYPELITMLGEDPLISLLWLSYMVFAVSWLYHNYKEE